MSKKLDSTNFVKCVTSLPPVVLLRSVLLPKCPFVDSSVTSFTVYQLYGLYQLYLRGCDAQCVISCVMSLKFEPNFTTICQFLNFITTPNT